jgi:hypothetical protein
VTSLTSHADAKLTDAVCTLTRIGGSGTEPRQALVISAVLSMSFCDRLWLRAIILYFLDIAMIELRCSLSIALALGSEGPSTRKHLEQLLDDANVIRVSYAACKPPLFWRWQLGRQDRPEARRNVQRGQ